MMFDDVGSISPHRATSVARTLREVEWKPAEVCGERLLVGCLTRGPPKR